ncbi:hypothetical protein GE09DRAFT_1196784 [Coniochaeta sp. 2T2.1]|nr:hypothetical protein GE09DRAFT_1196784 [Coniochaeta sp. 2T2.1]
MDVGFVNDPMAGKDSRCRWDQILVPGELKSNRSADRASEAWLDLGRYAREVLAAQDTRRFVLGFTICEPLMRVWVFDRLGSIASDQFDINKDGLRFVSTVLGFLWMSEAQLGFDPTIMTAKDERFIEIERNDSTERIIIDEVMQRARCIAGRATRCWRAHRVEDTRTPLVIKDSWQYAEREEEGEMLREATDEGVVNVARYYHHEIVRVHGRDDDIRSNIRKGLDVTTAANYRPRRSAVPPSTIATGARRSGRSGSIADPVRHLRHKADIDAIPNRIHRRVILRDYGNPIYKASSRTALLAALEGCKDTSKNGVVSPEQMHRQGILGKDARP